MIMIDSSTLLDFYVRSLVDYKNYGIEVMRHEVIKRRISLDGFDRQVLVGARRAGKSYILYGKIQELIAAGYSWDEIVYVNFEDEVWE